MEGWSTIPRVVCWRTGLEEDVPESVRESQGTASGVRASTGGVGQLWMDTLMFLFLPDAVINMAFNITLRKCWLCNSGFCCKEVIHLIVPPYLGGIFVCHFVILFSVIVWVSFERELFGL